MFCRPHINAEERDVNPVDPVTLGAGILMLALGVRKRLGNSYKNGKVLQR